MHSRNLAYPRAKTGPTRSIGSFGRDSGFAIIRSRIGVLTSCENGPPIGPVLRKVAGYELVQRAM